MRRTASALTAAVLLLVGCGSGSSTDSGLPTLTRQTLTQVPVAEALVTTTD